MAANQVDFKILPSDQFSVYSPATRSDKVITYFTLLSKLRGDILSVGQEDDPNNIVSAFYSSVGGTQTLHLVKADGSEVTASNSFAGTVTSVDMSVPTGFSISGNPITTSGTLAVGFASGYSLPTNAIQATWTTAYNRSLTSAAVTGTSTKTLTLNQQDGGTITASWSDIDTGLTSVGLTMPAAFSVANSPLTANGTLAVTAAGLSSQYIRGDGQLANFPTPGGGGSSVNYYLNGSVSQGTFGGDTYYELSKVPIAGAGTNFTRTHGLGDGYIASFITDANDPDQINIPGGNFNLEFYFNSSSSGGSPAFYGELYKVSVSNVFTLIASGSVNPESITGGTTVDQYYTSIAVPQTALLSTDRLAIRVYVIVSGKDITLHTENSNFCEVITTFSTGLNSLNGLSDQVQYFAVGTSGTDFAISSSLDTHTFNLPTASATNRGALSSADWTTFNGKASDAFKTIAVTGQSDIVADSATDTLNIVAGSGVTLTTNDTTDTLTISATGSGGTVTSVDLTAGTGISVSGGPITGSGSITVNNTAPDQTVVLTASTGITTSGTYPNFTIANSAPDQTVVLTGGTGITTSGTYPSFTVTNSAPDQTVVLTAGTGITTSGTYPSFTVTNSAPDQTVALTAGTGISISGTYPSFTITNTSAGGGTITGSGTTNYVPKWTSASAIGDSVIYDDGTNVGINTTTPTLNTSGRVLHINAPSNQASIVHFTNATTGALANDGLIVGRWDDGINYLFTYENEPLHFGTNTSIRMVITAAGNVGIGNTAPNQKLELSVGNAVTGGLRINYDAVATSEGMDITYLNSGNTTTSFDSRYNSDSAVMQFRMKTAATAVNAMTILGSGNVGIGTTGPSARLHVSGGDGIINNAFIGEVPTYTSANAQFSHTSRAAAGEYSFLSANDGETFINSKTGTNIRFRVNNNDKVIIDSAGNVGIGNTGPTQILHVTGNIRVTGAYYDSANAAGTSGQILSSTGTGTSWIAAPSGGGITGSGTTNYVTKWTSSSAVGNSSIFDDGNIGIGTASPAYKLDVDSGSGQIAARFYNSSNVSTVVYIGDTGNSDYADLILQSNSGSGEIFKNGTLYSGYGGTSSLNIYNSNGAIAFHPNNTANAMFIATNSNVGIGTTNPTSKLYIEGGSANWNETTPGLSVGTIHLDPGVTTDNFGNAITFGASDSDSGIYAQAGIYVRSDGAYGTKMYFATTDAYVTGSQTRMYISEGGNVGIGTTAPTAKLHIQGAATDNIGLALFENTWSGGSIYYPAATFINTRGDHSYGIVAGFKTGSVGGSDRPSILFYSDSASHSWAVGQVTSAWGSSDAFGIGYRASNDPNSFGAWPSNYFTILTGGNVGIGTTGPVTKLEVYGGHTDTTARLYSTGNGSGSDASLDMWASEPGVTYDGSGIGNNVNGHPYYGRRNTGIAQSYIRFFGGQILLNTGSTTASQTVTVLASGNVGIGTTNPLFKTTISADITKDGDLSPGTAQLSLEGITTPGKRMILGYDTNSNGFGFIKAGNFGVTWTVLSLQPDGGNVGVGTTAPGYKLDVSGTIRATGDVIAYSDARVKENVETLDGALDKVMKMRGVSYNKIGEQEKKVGVIAQEILEVLPEVVSQDDTGTYSVAYGNISAVLIEAIKELTNTVKEQQLQIDELKSKLK